MLAPSVTCRRMRRETVMRSDKVKDVGRFVEGGGKSRRNGCPGLTGAARFPNTKGLFREMEGATIFHPMFFLRHATFQ